MKVKTNLEVLLEVSIKKGVERMKYFNDVGELSLKLQKLGYMFDTYNPKTNLARYVKMVASGAIIYMVFEGNELVDYDFSLFMRKMPRSGSIMEKCYLELKKDINKLKEMQ